MFYSWIISWALSGLDSVIKNPEKREKYKSVLLEIAAKIMQTYGETEVRAAALSRQ